MRKTKIIATLGPATDSPEIIGRLIDAGMNIARLNMSHATHDWIREVVRRIRTVAGERGCHVGIMMDTQGPARNSRSRSGAKEARKSIRWM